MVEPRALINLIEAVDAEDSGQVDAILSRSPALSRSQIACEHGRTQGLLHRAMPGDGDRLTDAHLTIVRRLLDAGAEVNAPGWGANNGLCTPITMAAWSGHAPMIRLLVEHGADPGGSSEQRSRRHRPVDTAAHHGHTEAVEALIEAGAAYSLEHLLMVGARSRVEHLLAEHPDAAVRPLEGGATPLHLALTSRRGEELLELLLAHGADVNAADARGRTALHVALEEERLDAVRLLVARGAPIDIFAAAGLAEPGQVAAMLAEEPSRVRAAQADGVTPLFFAVWAGDLSSVERLLDAQAVVSPRAKRWWACLTPLHLALQKRHRDIAAALLARAADVNAFAAEPGAYWPTPLHVAARWGTREDVVLLMEHGADVNGGSAVPDSLDTSGLGWAVSAGNVPLVELMLGHGLDLRERHREALHLAAERGQVELIRLLIEGGADPRALDRRGQTPLDRAQTTGKTQAMELLHAAVQAA